MNYSDDIEIRDNMQSTEVRQGFDAEKTSEARPQTPEHNGFYAELAGIALKAVAVALSLVILITSVLAVALPLSAMRVFNKLGNSERAFDFGARYIAGATKKIGTETDELGNYTGLAQNPTTDGDLAEAFDVDIGLAYKLMQKYADRGDTARTEYFAEYLERYTRMYMSLGDASALIAAKDELRINGVPTSALRPYVYSYAHDLRVMNYRARTYLGETDKHLVNRNEFGNIIESISTSANSFYGQKPLTVTDNARQAALLDEFVDYVAQLGAYISVTLEKIGMVGAYGEGDVLAQFHNVLSGDEFSLFITRTGGFTQIYYQLKNFSEYANAAYYYPAETFDARLRQLYWLQELISASDKLWYMSMLLYYNRDMYGASSIDIINEYGTCEGYRNINVEDYPKGRIMAELYGEKYNQYISMTKV